MTICKDCDSEPTSNHCFICGRKPSATNGAEQRSDVGIIDWVAEWGAAIRHTENAVIMTPSTAMTDREWARSREALNSIRDIFDSMRSHSATTKLTDAGGEERKESRE